MRLFNTLRAAPRISLAAALAGLALLIGACTMGATGSSPVTGAASGPVPAPTPPGAVLRPASDFAGMADMPARSMALFQEAGKVILSPRCLNCHPNGDRPLQGNIQQLHQPLVVRGPDGFGATGMRCATCHGAQNFQTGPGASVPGSKNWHLAPLEMAWVGRSLGQICAQLKDPRRNGGKSMDQIVDHMAHDELVGWGWNPGAGRTPAPGTQQMFGELVKAWVDTGAHCPV